MSNFLEGNGRWQTKFMSPEHRDQLAEMRNEQPKAAGVDATNHASCEGFRASSDPNGHS